MTETSYSLTKKIPAPENLVENVSIKNEEQKISSQPESIKTEAPKSTRPKSTLNLNAILKAKESAPETLPQIVEPVDVKPLTDDQLREAWTDFANQRKNQVAEFHLLSRTIDVQGPTVTVALANSIEEPLLQNILPDLLTYLRGRLSNSSIKVESVLRKEDAKRIAYTNKEKFDLLAEKNPMLKELKERLGLDPDF
jgi:DNA polymerase-3 subunit gamma/tau